MRQSSQELDVVAEALGRLEPVGHEHTQVFPCVVSPEPMMVFARPSSMYPLASVDLDSTSEPTADLIAGEPAPRESQASMDPTTIFDPRDVRFDPADVIRRFDDVPTINHRTRVIARVRAKGTELPVALDDEDRQTPVELEDSYAAAMRKFR